MRRKVNMRVIDVLPEDIVVEDFTYVAHYFMVVLVDDSNLISRLRIRFLILVVIKKFPLLHSKVIWRNTRMIDT